MDRTKSNDGSSLWHLGHRVQLGHWHQMTVGSVADPEDLHAPTNALLCELSHDNRSIERVLLAWGEHPKTALGLCSPSWLRLVSGAELLIYHTPIHLRENVAPVPSESDQFELWSISSQAAQCSVDER